jgi:hypothetical protein
VKSLRYGASRAVALLRWVGVGRGRTLMRAVVDASEAAGHGRVDAQQLGSRARR